MPPHNAATDRPLTFAAAIEDLLRTLQTAVGDGACGAPPPRCKRIGNALVLEWRGRAITLQARCAILSESWWLEKDLAER